MQDATGTTKIVETPNTLTALTSSTSNVDAWKFRRRFMFAITAFCMAVIITALLVARVASVAEIAVIMGFGTLTSIFGFYVAGATWDDHSIRNFQIKGLQALQGPPAQPPAPTPAPVDPPQPDAAPAAPVEGS